MDKPSQGNSESDGIHELSNLTDALTIAGWKPRDRLGLSRGHHSEFPSGNTLCLLIILFTSSHQTV